jgi:hypothetical protein
LRKRSYFLACATNLGANVSQFLLVRIIVTTHFNTAPIQLAEKGTALFFVDDEYINAYC